MYGVMYHRIFMDEKSKKCFDGITFNEFKKQINNFKEKHETISIDESNFCDKEKMILTFDDGYKDHFEAAKELSQNNMKGIFFISSNVFEHRILITNLIHYILAYGKCSDIISDIKEQIIFYKDKFKLKSYEEYHLNIMAEKTLDSLEKRIIKRLLQRDLPYRLRKIICENLFANYVKKSFDDVFNELYLSDFEIREMKKMGMIFGNHTSNHVFLSRISQNEQKKEILDSLRVLQKNNIVDDEWYFAYPYGDYNKFTIEILKMNNCLGAFTIQNNCLEASNKYELGRIDCVDFLIWKKGGQNFGIKKSY